jgi:hypothetical protein
MKWRACIGIVFLIIIVVSPNEEKVPLYSIDGKLSEFSNQIAFPTCLSNNCIGLGHTFNAPINHSEEDVAAGASASTRDEEALQDIAKILVDFSNKPVGSSARHGIDSWVAVPPSRPQSQMAGKIHSPSTRADQSNPIPFDQRHSSTGNVASALKGKFTKFEKHPNLVNSNAIGEKQLSGARMQEGKKEISQTPRDLTSGLQQGSAKSFAGGHIASPIIQPEQISLSGPFHLKQNPRMNKFSESMPNKVDSMDKKAVFTGIKRKNKNPWGGSPSLKLTKKGKNVADMGSKKETIVTSLQSQSYLKVSPNIPVNFTRSKKPVAFLKLPENDVESRNTGSSFSQLNTKSHLSMIQTIHKPEVDGILHTHPNIMDIITKSHERRLKFDPDLFKYGEAWTKNQRDYIAKVLSLIPKPSEGESVLSLDQFEAATCLLCRSHSSLYSLLMPSEVIKIKIHKDVWYKYWKEEENLDFSKLENHLKFFKHDHILLIYLFLIKGIINLIPFKKNQPLNQSFDYHQEMEKAVESYIDFKKLMEYSESESEESKDIQVVRKVVLRSLKQQSEKTGSIIWKIVEFWMVKHYKDVYDGIKEGKGNRIINNFKSFFNSIFVYGIENMNKKMRFFHENGTR